MSVSHDAIWRPGASVASVGGSVGAVTAPL